jgi:hypothetical protein
MLHCSISHSQFKPQFLCRAHGPPLLCETRLPAESDPKHQELKVAIFLSESQFGRGGYRASLPDDDIPIFPPVNQRVEINYALSGHVPSGFGHY